MTLARRAGGGGRFPRNADATTRFCKTRFDGRTGIMRSITALAAAVLMLAGSGALARRAVDRKSVV